MMRSIIPFSLAALAFLPAASAQQDAPPGEGPTVLTGEETDVAPPTQAEPSGGTSALEGFHVGVSIGPVYFRDNEIGSIDIDYDTGSQFSLQAGTRFNILRTEIEAEWQYVEFEPSNSIFDGDLSVFRLTANAYLDIYSFDVEWIKHGGLTPYVGGGLGLAVANIEGFDDDESGFTVSGEAGVSVPIFRRIDVVPAYRFEWTDFDEFEKNQHAHMVRVGARYTF